MWRVGIGGHKHSVHNRQLSQGWGVGEGVKMFLAAVLTEEFGL